MLAQQIKHMSDLAAVGFPKDEVKSWMFHVSRFKFKVASLLEMALSNLVHERKLQTQAVPLLCDSFSPRSPTA